MMVNFGCFVCDGIIMDSVETLVVIGLLARLPPSSILFGMDEPSCDLVLMLMVHHFVFLASCGILLLENGGSVWLWELCSARFAVLLKMVFIHFSDIVQQMFLILVLVIHKGGALLFSSLMKCICFMLFSFIKPLWLQLFFCVPQTGKFGVNMVS